METGKIYTCELNLMLYPDPETAHFLTEPGMSNTEYAARRAGREYVYVESGMPILVLGRDGKCYEVLSGAKLGWIRHESWFELELKEIG